MQSEWHNKRNSECMRDTSLRLWNSEDTRDMMLSNLLERNIQVGKFGGRICYYESKSSGVLRLRSKLELAACWWLDHGSITYEYEPRWFISGSCRYLPDLWIPEFGVYVEVKPYRRRQVAFDKIEMIKDVLDAPIIVWTEKDLKEGLSMSPYYESHETITFKVGA